MFVFYHAFPLLWELSFLMSWEICKKPTALGYFVFSYTFPTVRQFTFPMLSEVYGFLLLATDVKNS